jgi:hypothetical protein
MAETRKRTAGETLDALRRLAKDDRLDDALADTRSKTDDEIARAIEAEGGDAKGIGERGAALAARLLERRERLSGWQERAAAALAKATARARQLPRTPPSLGRAELERRLSIARADPRFTAPVAAAFRNRSAEESTDEELAALLDEIEILKGLAREPGEPGDGER